MAVNIRGKNRKNQKRTGIYTGNNRKTELKHEKTENGNKNRKVNMKKVNKKQE